MQDLSKIMAKRLYMWRRDQGLSQGDLAKKMGTSQTVISLWESGRTKQISPRLLVALADAMDVSLDYLLGRTDET